MKKLCLFLCLLVSQLSHTGDMLDLDLEEMMDLNVSSMSIMKGDVPRKGTWTLSYDYGYRELQGLRDGTSPVSNASVLTTYQNTPLWIHKQRHSLSVLYGTTEKLAFSASLPYVVQRMKIQDTAGLQSEFLSSGIGDLLFSANYALTQQPPHQLTVNLGLSVPTGSINQKSGYPMQLGSGSYDLVPTLTYIGDFDPWGWAIQASGKLPTKKNSNEYRLGNEWQGTVMVMRAWNEWFTNLLFITAEWNGRVHGSDPLMNTTSVPTSDPAAQGGRKVTAHLDFNFFIDRETGSDHLLSIGFTSPIHQSLNGPQLKERWSGTASWSCMF